MSCNTPCDDRKEALDFVSNSYGKNVVTCSSLSNRRTRIAYLYNACLAWYNVVLTAQSLKREIQTTTNTA